MNETPRKKVQYSYRLSKEKLREFLSFSPEAKLEWLEAANRFINEFLPSEKRKRWEEFIRQKQTTVVITNRFIKNVS